MKRKDLIAAIRFAGYHNDIKTGTRLFIEYRIARAVYDEAFNAGRAAKANGVGCSCINCKPNR